MPGGDMAGGGPGGMPGGDMAGGPGGMPGGGMPEGGMPGGPGGDMAGGGPGGGAMPAGGSSGAKLALANGKYNGNIFNGSGYWGQSGNALEITVGNGATLTGAISLTETRHIDENGKQNTHFTINEYYYLGHVENRNYRNKTAKIDVVLKDGGVWKVTGESLISSLTVEDGKIKNGKMTINGVETPIKKGETYTGDIIIAPAK
jgi:hypothetical protein